jgi:hypothetical protein
MNPAQRSSWTGKLIELSDNAAQLLAADVIVCRQRPSGP